MNRKRLLLAAATLVFGFAVQTKAALTLGTAGNFAVLAGSTVTSTGLSVINGGDVGVAPGTAITGFGPGILLAPYAFHSGDAVALAAQGDLTTAYNDAAALPVSQSLTGQDLGGQTLMPGVYFFSSSAQLTGILTLNDNNDPNAQFVFQIGSTLTTASNSAVVTIEGGSNPGANVFWQVGSSATIGTGTAFEGTILAHASITMNTDASLLGGSALASVGAVTLEDNSISASSSASSVPEPASVMVVLIGGALLGQRRPGRRSDVPCKISPDTRAFKCATSARLGAEMPCAKTVSERRITFFPITFSWE
jgi:type VI secretion system secreted protein VgrG